MELEISTNLSFFQAANVDKRRAKKFGGFELMVLADHPLIFRSLISCTIIPFIFYEILTYMVSISDFIS